MATSEVAVSLAIVRLHDLLSKTKNIITYRKLREDITVLISNLQTILITRKPAELNDGHSQETQEGEQPLLHCAHEAEQIAEAFLVYLLRYQMSELKEGCFAKVLAPIRLFSLMSRVRAWKKEAKDFMTPVRLLCSQFASPSSSSKRNQENTRQRVESDIVGRDKYVEYLLAWLINDHEPNLRVISVVGEQACGKTALVRSVLSKLKIKHHFDCRAWVRVPDLGMESDRMKSLLVDIFKQTPLQDEVKDLEHKQEEQLFEMLHKSLMGIRYLIVLDNLREPSLINELLVPFVDSMNGSRVIVTTPNAEVQKFADVWTPDLPLHPDMTDKECKELLRGSITGDDDSEKRILSKCNGSPLAISLLGGLLSAVEESNWVGLVDRLGESPTLDDVTHLSFNDLPYVMKPRVLYMALFPKESEVPTRRLFRQWAAEGLLAEVTADRSVQMQQAEDCFRKLESRNFIHVVRRKLDGSAQSCRMPAFLHEFCRQKAKEFKILQIQNSSDSVPEKESRGNDHIAEQSAQNQQKQVQNTATGHYGYKVQFLKSFTSFNTRKLGTQSREIEDLLKSPISPDLLRVVDLEGVYKPVLPENFGNTMLNLRYLGLRWTILDSIPESVGNLLLLETLDLKHTNITKVMGAIWNAKNLRHLYLSEASFDKSIPCRISSTKLETLWGLFIETAESHVISVLKELKSLKKLGVTCRPGAVEAVTKNLKELSSLESLRLRARDLFGQPASLLDLSIMKEPEFGWPECLSNLYLLGSFRPIKDLPVHPGNPKVLSSVKDLSFLPGNLKVLTLSMSELEFDPMSDLGRLSDLIVLRLLARSYIGESSAEPHAPVLPSLYCRSGFPKLRVLKLWTLDKLGILVVEQGAMSNLEELEIRQCENLGKVIGLDHINSLKSVWLTRVQKDLTKHIRVPQHTLVKTKELLSKKESKSKNSTRMDAGPD